jgi:predicted TPR repeat methyltransferase
MTQVIDPDASAPCPCGSGLEAAQCCSRHRFEQAASHHDFALGELENGRPAAAVTALEEALALAPRRASAHNDLGLALKESGRLEEAERAHRDALSLDPTYAAAHRNLGEVLRQRGALESARGCFETALRLNPALNPCRLDLGQVLEDLGELGPASRCYEEAIERSSAPASIYIRLGTVLWRLGDALRALQAFERAVAGAPGSAEALYNLGSAQLELGRFAAAGHSAAEALQLRPEFSEAALLRAAALAASGSIEMAVELLRRPDEPYVAATSAVARTVSAPQRYLLLATRLMNSRLFDPARHCLEAVLREDPAEPMAQHLLSALSGANPDRPADGYVRQLFDTSAATFDRDLSRLGYDIPREMVRAVLEVAGPPVGRWDVLDLGCGTGLVGEQVACHSGRLVGVDLAPNMIERARTRGFYTDLHCADITAALALEESSPERFDVVTAADVFIYVGRLESVIPAIGRVLRPGGWFAFSAEAVESIPGATSSECRLGIMGRYAHGADYLRRLAAQHCFSIELLRPTRIRFEHRRPVEGWLTLWRAPR